MMIIGAGNNEHQNIAAAWWMLCEDHVNPKKPAAFAAMQVARTAL
jgi:hypothetical protein